MPSQTPAMIAARQRQQELEQKRALDLALSNSVTLAVEYLSFAINSILYLRGIYPSNSFKSIDHPTTGLSLMVSNDQGVTGYLGAVLSQVAQWLAQDKIRAISLIIFPDGEPPQDGDAVDEGDVVERWTFQFRRNSNDLDISKSSHASQTGSAHLANALRHLTASCGMLPARKSISTFEVITYNNIGEANNTSSSSSLIPKSWELSDPMELEGADELPLRPFDCNGIFVDGFITFYGNENGNENNTNTNDEEGDH